ncbi:hypothetical protein [Paraburkholderia oxyphila]|uniref:hypothetical protein n=1 Tax=Paraburkholderia oxyphila TaxID=614212 RepID=UPI0012ED01A4|nr:hypothetical protein [Paraburkholderia oxyphila]
MRTRSSLEICAPLGIFIFACALSISTLVIAIVWMMIGVCCLGYRTVADFPAYGVPHRWRHGPRSGCLLFYHLAWWPWYMRHELRDFATQAQVRLVRGNRSRDRRTRSGHESDGNP